MHHGSRSHKFWESRPATARLQYDPVLGERRLWVVKPNTHHRRYSTVELSRVGGVNAPVNSRDPVYNFLCFWAISVGDKWRHNDVIAEKVINMDQNSRSQTDMESVWSVSKLSTESVGSRRELVANSVHTAGADATQFDSWVASSSAVCTGYRVDYVTSLTSVRDLIRQIILWQTCCFLPDLICEIRHPDRLTALDTRDTIFFLNSRRDGNMNVWRQSVHHVLASVSRALFYRTHTYTYCPLVLLFHPSVVRRNVYLTYGPVILVRSRLLMQ